MESLHLCQQLDVIDYFIISSQLFIYVKDFEILYVDISDHFPLSYTMR